MWARTVFHSDGSIFGFDMNVDSRTFKHRTHPTSAQRCCMVHVARPLHAVCCTLHRACRTVHAADRMLCHRSTVVQEPLQRLSHIDPLRDSVGVEQQRRPQVVRLALEHRREDQSLNRNIQQTGQELSARSGHRRQDSGPNDTTTPIARPAYTRGPPRACCSLDGDGLHAWDCAVRICMSR